MDALRTCNRARVVGLALLLGYATAPAVEDLSPSQQQFLVGNTLWTLVHEMGHALISELDIHVLGREEDVADLLASLALLHGTPNHAHGDEEIDYLWAAAVGWRTEWWLSRHDGDPTPYWDSHSLDIQRYYNIVCLMYGHNPEMLEQHPDLDLPGGRAVGCSDHEYLRAEGSVRRMLTIYGRSERQPGGAKVAVRFEAPTRAGHQPLADIVEASGVAAHVAEQTEMLFVLPRPISLVFGACLGDESAFWRPELGEIVVCYDLLERFVYLHGLHQCLERADEDSLAARRSCARSVTRYPAGG